MSIHIEGRRWFQRTHGNTYHSVRIFKDGTQLVCLPYAYGYGDQYIETALEWLEDQGHIEARKRYPSGGKEGGTYFLRETLGASHSCIDVERKKEL